MSFLLQIAIFAIISSAILGFTYWMTKRIENGKTDADTGFGLIAIGILLMTVNGCLFGAINTSDNYIPAIEVYRGKTEMIINTQSVGDSIIAKDTTVVWKDKI